MTRGERALWDECAAIDDRLFDQLADEVPRLEQLIRVLQKRHRIVMEDYARLTEAWNDYSLKKAALAEWDPS